MTIKLTGEFEQFTGLEISWILRGRVEMKAQKTGAMHMSVLVQSMTSISPQSHSPCWANTGDWETSIILCYFYLTNNLFDHYKLHSYPCLT